ncbi:hypothetical protein KEC97_004475 [Escherichia coli]|nr:hypothetical protein [Escherichia coli]
MAWTGFGGSWSGGVHSGGDDSGSIGGGSGGGRAPSAADIASQYNSFGGPQIKASDVSNIRSNGDGGYSADIRGAHTTVSSELGTNTSTTVSGFTGVSTPGGSGNGGNGGNSSLTSSPAINNQRNKEVARGVLDHAKKDAEKKAATLSKAKASVTQAQTRLNNATAKMPVLQAAVPPAQKKFDDAKKIADSLSRFASAPPISNHFREWQRAGFEAQKAQDALNNAKKALANGPVEIAAAEKALDNARKAVVAATSDKQKADQAVASASEMMDAITAMTTFFEGVSKKFGERAARMSQVLADQARSAKIRSVPEAITMFNKHKVSAFKKLTAADKTAIVNAFKSLEQADIAKQLTAYSKVFGRFNKTMDFAGLAAAVKKGIETGDWNETFKKLETIALTNATGQLVAVAFAAAGAPLGIVAFGVILMLAGALFSNDTVLSAINTALGM